MLQQGKGKKRSSDLREYKLYLFNLYKTEKLFLAISPFQKLILNKNEQKKYHNQISLKVFIRKKYGKKLKNILREITEKFTYKRDKQYKLKFQNNLKQLENNQIYERKALHHKQIN